MTSGVIRNERGPLERALLDRLSNLRFLSEEIRAHGIEGYSTVGYTETRCGALTAALAQPCIDRRVGVLRITHVHHQEYTHAHRRTVRTGVAGVTA